MRLVSDLPSLRPFKAAAHGLNRSAIAEETFVGQTFESRNDEEESSLASVQKSSTDLGSTKASRRAFFVPCINSPHALKSVAIPHNVSEGQGDAIWRCRVTGTKIEQNRTPSCDTSPPERMTP